MIKNSKFFFVASIASIALNPSVVSAQIIISEFLYDAPGSDADQEFVELFNAGTSAVDLTQWKINDGSNHTLNVPPKNGGTGSITIAPGAYLLLVDDAAAFIPLHSGIAVSIIDTVLSLTNIAGTISLINEEGTTVDSISYTKDQGGAGDEHSLTRTSVSGATLTSGSPTPGTGSFASGSSSGTTQSTGGTTASQSQSQAASTSESSSQNSSYVAPPETQLFADAGNDRVVTVGADVRFVGRAYNRKKEVVDNARLVWNFGDGSTAEGTSVSHHFNYPGRYVVFLDIAQSEYAASDQIIVTAEKANITFLVVSDGSVSIENHSKYTLDLSHWIIREQSRNFVLPDHSLVLSGASMQISQQTLGFPGSASVEIAYPNGIIALRAGESTEGVLVPETSQPESQTAPQAAPISGTPKVSVSESTSLTRSPNPEDTSDVLAEENAPDAKQVGSSTQVAAAANVTGTSYVWWLGVATIAVLTGGALFAARRFSKREWDISEE